MNQLLLDLGHVVLNQHLYLLGVELDHVLNLLLDTVRQGYLVFPPLLEHQSFEGVFQELEQQYFG